MVRLRRSSPDRPGLTRHRRGRGWQYLDADGKAVDDATRQRITELVIPPAWQDVWISPWPNGHIQAVGTDDAGRRQYLYHADWTARRHRHKFARVSEFAGRLPAARREVDGHLALPGMPEERALATAFSLLDRGHFRVGGEVYAQSNGSFGLATLRRDQVRRERGALVFDYTAKSGLRRVERIDEPRLADSIAVLLRRRGGNPELLSYRTGRSWRPVGSAAINGYLKEVVGPDFSAKDFRTWHGTVLAAVALADRAAEPPAKGWSTASRTRAERAAVAQVSDVLGNTPAVCRGSYIDPRVLDAFEHDRHVGAAVRRVRRGGAPGSGDELVSVAYTPTVERAVRKLLRDGG